MPREFNQNEPMLAFLYMAAMSGAPWKPFANDMFRSHPMDFPKARRPKMSGSMDRTHWSSEHLSKAERKGKTIEEIAELRKKRFEERTGLPWK